MSRQDELTKLGMKVGGTLEERGARLWRTRGISNVKDLLAQAPELAAGGAGGGKKRGRQVKLKGCNTYFYRRGRISMLFGHNDFFCRIFGINCSRLFRLD